MLVRMCVGGWSEEGEEEGNRQCHYSIMIILFVLRLVFIEGTRSSLKTI